MSENKNVNNTYYGASFLQLLTIVFIVLKLCGVINWSWWFVLIPLWLPVLLVLIICFVIFMLISSK